MPEIKGVIETTLADEGSFLLKPAEIALDKNAKGIALPPGWTYKEYDQKNLLEKPLRKSGLINMQDAESFISYVNRHKSHGFTSVYCNTDYLNSRISITSIINDHGGEPDAQKWKDHIVIYKPNLSEEWNRWTLSDRKPHSQLELALFLEENLQDIPAIDGYPTGQQLLEMATSFQANQDMKFKSAIRLQNGGVNMNFIQDDDNQTLSQMKMFEKIAIGIPVFWNGDAYQVTARLRYRVKDGKLSFWYELIRKDKVFEDATIKLINNLKTATNVPFYYGSA